MTAHEINTLTVTSVTWINHKVVGTVTVVRNIIDGLDTNWGSRVQFRPPASMSSPPLPPTPKRGIRTYIRDKYDRLVRTHSKSPSAEASGSSSGAYLVSPPLQTQSISTTLAPPITEEGTGLPHPKSPSIILSTPKLVVDSVDVGNAQWVNLRDALQALHDGASIFPPLQMSVGALISCLNVFKVNINSQSCIV